MPTPTAPSASERLLGAMQTPMARWDTAGRLLFCNAAYAGWAGIAPATCGHRAAQLHGRGSGDALQAAIGRAAQGHGGWIDCPPEAAERAGAPARWARMQVIPEPDAAGHIVAVVTMVIDVHAEVMLQHALAGSRRRLDRFTDHIPFPLAYVDPAGIVRYANRAFAAMSGTPATELVGRPACGARAAAPWNRLGAALDRALAGEAMQDTRLVELPGAGARWLRSSFVPEFASTGAVEGVYVVTMDVHELTVEEERLRRCAERDPLTDALSRRSMMERIEHAVAAAIHAPVALFFVDLDGFKAINDAHGHGAGDEALVAAAAALQGAVRSGDAVGRLGGDEFLVLAEVQDAGGARRMAKHLREAVRQCAPRPGGRPLSASIGYALAPDDATQAMSLLRLADGAMYEAKRRGKDAARHCGAPAQPA